MNKYKKLYNGWKKHFTTRHRQSEVGLSQNLLEERKRTEKKKSKENKTKNKQKYNLRKTTYMITKTEKHFQKQ